MYEWVTDPEIVVVWAALAKAQQLLHDEQERDYIVSQVNSAKGQ